MSARKIILLLFVVMPALLASGQLTGGGHLYPNFPDSIPTTDIIRQTEALPASVLKVRQLLGISHIYVDHGRNRNLDTSLKFLNEAYTIGKLIRDTPGICDVLACKAEIYLFRGEVSPAAALLTEVDGEERIRLLLIIAEGFVNVQPVEIPYLEKALPYLSSAIRLADSIGAVHWRYECLMVQAKYFFEHGNMDPGKNAILAIIKSCDSLKDIKGVGHYWSEMNMYMPITPQNAAYHLFACRQSIRAYSEAGDQHDALYALRDLAVMHRVVGAYDSSESEFFRFLRETAKSGITPSTNTNYEMAALYLNKGDLARALNYSLQALASLSRKNISFSRFVYGRLALIYQQTDMPAEELNYGRMAVEGSVRFKAGEQHYHTTFVIDALIRQGSPNQALAYLQELNAANPVRSPEERAFIAYDYGLIYDALGAYPRAYSYFRQFTDLDSAAQAESGTSVFWQHELNPFLVHLYIGRFYVHWGKYQQARIFLQKALADPPLNRQSAARSELELLLYKTDSAAGDLRSAIAHFMLHTALRDSIFDVKKMQQFQTLQVQYQTKQREQSFRLLESESERQRAELHQASVIRKIAFGGIVLLLIVACWAYYAYQAKRRNVQQLTAQQLVINEKNLRLQQVVGEKNELLTEKNLLLQEVHHRVKNNLHTIMSLLESQSAYLSDKAARSVLLDSQNRIHAISLLHQKLYWSSNVTSVEMSPYIAELSAFLASSLGARERRITISQSVEPIMLDISLALPIGLLLNEAITNSLKHAFPDNTSQNAVRPGHIAVTMRRLADGLVSLDICDDGVGMPGSTGAGLNSLGMTLIHSIGQKLGGRLSIPGGDKGVRVELVFNSGEVFS